MNSIRITVKPIPGITTEEARDVRSRALRYALDRYFEKRESIVTSGNDHMEGESKNGSNPRP